MFLAPVIERELRRALHANKGYKSRFRVALIGAVVVVVFLWIFALSGSAQWGWNLHQLFFWASLYLAIAPSMRISVGLFSEERRNQTLELLFLTGMGSGELFIGKLLGGTLVASSDLLALAPLLAMPFLIGGISLDLYLATLACLPALLLFVVAVGVLASVLFKDDGVAFVFMVVFAGSICLAAPIPYYLGQVLIGTTPFSEKWLCISPAYAPYLVSINFGTAGPSAFWMAELAIFAWSCLCLALACFVLSHNWRTEVRGTLRTGWRGRFNTWVQGGQSWRTSLKKKVLLANPFQWLVQQDRGPVLLGYATLGSICLLWLMGWRTWPQAWPSNANFFITAMVLIAIVNWLRLFAAARRIGTDRRDGILELLLTTSLSPQEMVDGQVAALTAEFKPLQFVVLCLLILMMAGGFMIHSWNARAAITYLLVWGVLCGWCLKNPRSRILKVMWAALNTGRPAYSVFQWRGNRWTWFWVLYNLRNIINNGFGGGSAVGFPSGSIIEFTFVCVMGVLAGVFYYLGRAVQQETERDIRRRLIMEMRIIATEPIPDPNDPSFKNWENTHRIQYRAGATPVHSGWPGFVDPAERPQAHGRAVVLQDTLELCRILNEQKIDYVIVGELAMSAYLADRITKDADLLMSPNMLNSVPEMQVQEQTDFFCCGRFRGIQVVVYSTANPFFETVRLQFATTVRLAGRELPAVTVEGLIALNLYAIYLLTRQRDYYRNERYELNIITLLARYEISFEPILSLVSSHVPPDNVKELEDTLEACGKHAARLRKRDQVKVQIS